MVQDIVDTLATLAVLESKMWTALLTMNAKLSGSRSKSCAIEIFSS